MMFSSYVPYLNMFIDIILHVLHARYILHGYDPKTKTKSQPMHIYILKTYPSAAAG